MTPNVIRFFEEDIWKIRLKELPLVKAYPLRYLRVAVMALRSFSLDQCSQKASALTYYSLLSVVPVMAMAFGIGKGFGLEDMIVKQINEAAKSANWQPEFVERIISFSHSLLENAKGGLIAGVGVIMVFWTVISIMGHIEESFNAIWEVRKPRALKQKFSDYLSVMILAPILLVISSSAAVLLATQITVIVQKVAVLGMVAPLIRFLLQLLPYVSLWILFTVLYLLMPNTKVPLKSGIVAGITTGTIYQIVQWIYIKFQIGVSSYGAIYGSFAALPLFLVWMQLSWMIVLFGAEIAVADENYETFGYHPDYSRISMSSRKLLVLRVYHLLVKRFCRGETPPSASEIAHGLEIPVRLVKMLLHELTGAGMVTEAVTGSTQVAYQPGKTVEQVSVKYVLDVYEERGVEPIPLPASEEVEKMVAHLKSLSDAAEKSPGNVALKEI